MQKVANHHSRNNLQDSSRQSDYDSVMPTSYWERVGATLRTHRELTGWSNTNAFKAAHRSAPHVNTMNDIEDGNPGSTLYDELRARG